MAFVNFFLIPGTGADINAGSSSGAAAVTTTNGNWNATTGVFIAASGTPFASTVAGDYASIYNDGVTVTPFVAKVLSKDSSTQITVDVATIKYGTAPTTNATARSCTINGAWASELVLAAGGLATTIVPQSTKINITGNLTITASRTISMAGAQTAPLWFSCYASTPGDLDNDTTNALTKPVWTMNAGTTFNTTGNHQMWSGLSVVGNRDTTNVWNWTGTFGRQIRCRVENTSSNASAYTIGLGAGNVLAYCWFKLPTTATVTGILSTSGSSQYVGCVFEGGGVAGAQIGTNGSIFAHCVFLNNTGTGILLTTGQPYAINCTFYNPSVNGIKWTGSIANASVVVGCLFIGGTNGINNASGANIATVLRACNDFYNVTNPEVGFGDSPSFFGQTESADPTFSSTDLRIKPGTNARNNGFPGVLETLTPVNNNDIGAYQSGREPVGRVSVVSGVAGSLH